MAADLIILNITCVSFFLLAFIGFFNPLKVNVIANRWFAVFLFSAGSAVLDVIVDKAGARGVYWRLVSFNELSRLAMMPALYLSVLHYTSPEKSFSKTEYLHLIPFFLFFIGASAFVYTPKQVMFNSDAIPYVIKMGLQVVIKLAIPFQLVICWMLSYYRLKRHQKSIQLITSNTAPVNLNWLKLLLLGVLALIVVNFADRIFANTFRREYAPQGYLISVLFVAYFFIGQKEVYPYEAAELESINKVINHELSAITNKQRFPEEVLVQLKARLVHIMENDRIFLDNELGLPELSKEMNISPHDLSYLLNAGFGVNFFQFINSYRVDEAKRLMLSDEHRHLNLLGVAYSAGFNSKTTFNTAFKKDTGLSPSQFIQQTKANIASTSAQ